MLITYAFGQLEAIVNNTLCLQELEKPNFISSLQKVKGLHTHTHTHTQKVSLLTWKVTVNLKLYSSLIFSCHQDIKITKVVSWIKCHEHHKNVIHDNFFNHMLNLIKSKILNYISSLQDVKHLYMYEGSLR